MSNVALASEGAKIYADSTRAETSASSVISGHGGRWMPLAYKSHPHWLWVRFRSAARISRVVLDCGGAKAYPVDFTGEYSPDGGRTFRTLFKVTGNHMESGKTTVERLFTPVVADNFRLRIDRSADLELIYWSQVCNLQVFGEFLPGSKPQVGGAPPAPRLLASPSGPEMTARGNAVEFRSKWLRVVLSTTEPRILAMSWDGLGNGKLEENFLKEGRDAGARLALTPPFPEAAPVGKPELQIDGNVVRYTMKLAMGAPALWEIRVQPRSVETAFSDGSAGPTVIPPGIQFAFDLDHRCTAPIVNPRPGEPSRRWRA